MAELQPHHEALRVTLTRTLSFALVAGAVVALSTGSLKQWPALSLVMFWPSFGGHWIDVLFLNGLRPRLPASRIVQRVARVAVWFVGGVLIGVGVRLTAGSLLDHPRLAWLTWVSAGVLFVLIELAAHAALQLRGRPSFYNGLA